MQNQLGDDYTAAASWPPQRGDIWLTTVGWRQNDRHAQLPAGSTILILSPSGQRYESATGTCYWSGDVMGPYGTRWIKVIDGDLIACQRIADV